MCQDAIETNKTLNIFAAEQIIIRHSRKRRSLLRALSKFLAISRTNRCNEPRRCQIRSEEISADQGDVIEDGASQCGAPERCIGQIRLLEACEFQVRAREIRVAQRRTLEIGGFQHCVHETHGLIFHVGAKIGTDEHGVSQACPGQVSHDTRAR